MRHPSWHTVLLVLTVSCTAEEDANPYPIPRGDPFASAGDNAPGDTSVGDPSAGDPATPVECDTLTDITSDLFGDGYPGFATTTEWTPTCSAGGGTGSALAVRIDTPGNYNFGVSGVSNGAHASSAPDAALALFDGCTPQAAELGCDDNAAFSGGLYVGIRTPRTVALVLDGDYFLDGYTVWARQLSSCLYDAHCDQYFPFTHCDAGTGACVEPLDCPTSLRDCDGVYANGCETDIHTNTAHCGECDLPCSGDEVLSMACVEGECVVESCMATFSDCDDDGRNGCECGAYMMNVESAACLAGECIPTCEGSWLDCSDATAGCETNGQWNQDHCGDCNWPCNDQQTCVSADCRAAPSLADLSGNNTDLVLFGATLFWLSTDNGASTVYSLPTTGGSPSVVASYATVATGLLVDDMAIYARTGNDLTTAPRTGGTPTALATNLSRINGLTMDSTSLYVLETTGGYSWCLHRLPKQGGALVEVVCDYGEMSSLTNQLEANESAVFADGIDWIYRIDTTTGDTTTVGHSGAGPFALGPDAVYVADTDTVYRMPFDDTPDTEIDVYSTHRLFGLEWLRFEGSGLVMGADRIATVGTTGDTFTNLATPKGAVRGLAADASRVYWLEDEMHAGKRLRSAGR